MKPDTQAVFPGDLHAAPTYDGSQCLGARLHYAYREAMGHKDRDQSLYAKFPADEQAFWNRAAVGFVARLSDAPDPGAVEQARKALAAWDRYQPNVDRAETVEQACAMAAALRRLLKGQTA